MKSENCQIGPPSQTKVVSVVLRFAAEDLFVVASLDEFESLEEARVFIISSPKLEIKDNWLYLRCQNGRLVPLFKDNNSSDECGRWILGANRVRIEDFLDSLLNIQQFLELNPVASDFNLYWFSITEWATGEKGPRLLTSTSGYIDRTVLDEQR